MTLTKRELEDLNEALQGRVQELTAENRGLTRSLERASERLTTLEQR